METAKDILYKIKDKYNIGRAWSLTEHIILEAMETYAIMSKENSKVKELQKLSYENIKPDLLVKDGDGNIGKITDGEHDIHNVEVEYLMGGKCVYCLDETCNCYKPLYMCN